MESKLQCHHIFWVLANCFVIGKEPMSLQYTGYPGTPCCDTNEVEWNHSQLEEGCPFGPISCVQFKGPFLDVKN